VGDSFLSALCDCDRFVVDEVIVVGAVVVVVSVDADSEADMETT